MSKNKKIILATTSPYRQEAFKFLEIDFIAEGSRVDENFKGRPDNPKKLVVQLAKLKAEAVAKNHSTGIVIGFDSVGFFNGKILEKPKTKEEAFRRLKLLSNNNHHFYTGVYIVDISANTTTQRVVETKITMREISDTEIEKYLDQDSHFNTYALGYDPLGHYSSSFAIKIEGSYNNFTRGIPLETIVEILKETGYPVEETGSGRLRITICGSSTFRKQMVKYRDALNKLGHEAIIHPYYKKLADGEMPELIQRMKTEHAQVKKEYNFIRWYHDEIKKSDAILVLNFDKNDIKNYIGGNTLMEMGFAHANRKKVFLLNSIPEKAPYLDEIQATVDLVLNGDVNNIQ